jgi:peptidoglycan/LPS O-acetylase OafA/YrhL
MPSSYSRLPAPITGSESLYLDLLRGLAAILVVLDHAQNQFDLPYLPRLGHQAVVLFFVLSGYVICNTADSRTSKFADFVVARLARLWSVLVPALLLTIVCDMIGRLLGTNPGVYDPIHDNLPVIRIGAALTFLSESWFSIQPLSNGAVWSLSVEFWYYIIFATVFLLPAGPLRIFMIAAATLVAGFKAILLLPIWLMGVALQRWHRLRQLSPAACLLCATGGLAVASGIWIASLYDFVYVEMRQLVSPWLLHQLAQARYFALDWIFGAALAVHLIGMRRLSALLPLERVAAPIRFCANLSFSAYLFHTPLLYLCAAFLSPNQGWLALAITAMSVIILGRPAESSKSWWRARIQYFVYQWNGAATSRIGASTSPVTRPAASS